MSKAFIYEIKPSSWDSHQTSPGHMITALRWSVRDVYNYSGNNMETREPMIIYNDCFSLTVTTTKKGTSSQVVALLKGGDINYSTALNPGDFLLINQVNDEFKIANGENCLVNRAKNLQPINLVDDGFKGVFKVQTCKRHIKTDGKTGKKVVFYVLHAFSHQELQTVVYYDPVVYGRFTGQIALFMSQFNKGFGDLISSKENNNIQEILQVLIRTLIGQGLNDIDLKVQPKPNNHFLIPSMLGPLLGRKNAKYACEIYNYFFGIWQKGATNGSNLAKGFNPGMTRSSDSFFKTQQPLDGRRILSPEYWNQIKVWSILTDYLNETVNEMYTTCRIDPNGFVLPSLVIRQKPFTSQHFQGTNSLVSRHLEMPRWKISPDLITDIELGKDEAARINFVQIYTRSLAVNDANNRAAQVGDNNFVADINDIIRSGLRPYLATANFDFPRDSDKRTKGKEWSRLVADFLFEGHLRSGGTIECVGIEEPISVGDNLELDDVVYHIESVVHNTMINPNGVKSFRTQLMLSFGTDVRSNKTRPVYPDMEFTDYETAALDDFAHERILPGWGEAQDIQGRDNGEETHRTPEQSFTPGNPARPEFTGENTGENHKLKKK